MYDFASQLESLDWSFTQRVKPGSIESIHPYPAKFIAEIPRAFLSTLPLPEGTMVLDPFCGSGTTLMESQRAGIPSVGIDLNPIACLISRVKTSPAPAGFERSAIEVLEAARDKRDPSRQEIPNVDHWFKPEVQEAIAALVEAIERHPETDCRDALRLALSSILVRVSNQESDTRYAAVDKSLGRRDVFDLFLSASGKLLRALAERRWPLVPTKVIEADVLTVPAAAIGRPVGMVITSPPYPNAYEYWLYHKYRMWWLGFDPLAVKSKEIGARAHFFKREHHTEGHFWEQMRRTFGLIDAVLVRSGFVCFVVGRSKIHGVVIDNANIIRAIAEERGMRLITRIERVLSPSRKSFNLSHANIKTESVIVFQKG